MNLQAWLVLSDIGQQSLRAHLAMENNLLLFSIDLDSVHEKAFASKAKMYLK